MKIKYLKHYQKTLSMTLENSRFFQIVERLKKEGKINDYVNFATMLETNKAGINDLKQGRKKLSIEIIRRMKYSYPSINLNWLITGEGEMLDSDQKVHAKKASETGNENSMSQSLELINKLLEQAKEIGKLENEIKNLQEKLGKAQAGVMNSNNGQEEDAQDAGSAAVGL